MRRPIFRLRGRSCWRSYRLTPEGLQSRIKKPAPKECGSSAALGNNELKGISATGAASGADAVSLVRWQEIIGN